MGRTAANVMVMVPFDPNVWRLLSCGCIGSLEVLLLYCMAMSLQYNCISWRECSLVWQKRHPSENRNRALGVSLTAWKILWCGEFTDYWDF